jgi:aquaporin related protein
VDLFKTDYIDACLCTGIICMLLYTLGPAMNHATYNPALALTSYIMGKLSMWKMISCIIAQLVAGFLASAVLVFSASYIVFDKSKLLSKIGLPMIGTDFSQFEAFMVEFSGSVFLTLVYIRVRLGNDIMPQVKGIMIGGAFLINMCCFYNVSGACFNPALIFGPSFLSRYLTDYQWIYYFGPVLGSIVGSGGFLVYNHLMEEDADRRAAHAVQAAKEARADEEY